MDRGSLRFTFLPNFPLGLLKVRNFTITGRLLCFTTNMFSSRAFMGTFSGFLRLFSLLGLSLAVSLQSSGSTFILEGIPYFAPPFPVGSINPDTLPSQIASANGLVPITILGESTSVNQLLQNFSTIDDVFSQGFLQGSILAFPSSFNFIRCSRSLLFGNASLFLIILPILFT